MSEGMPAESHTPERFWERRWHYVLNALAHSGATSVDPNEYESVKDKMRRLGFEEPWAAQIAFATCSRDVPSACEVNPW